MSLLGDHRLGVSPPLPPSHTIHEPPKPLSRDLEDLESLIRSLADEMERAEDQRAMQKSDTNTGKGSPDLLATPVTASNSPISEMGVQVITPPPVRHREHTPKSASREGRGSDEKARLARSREKSGVSTGTGSEGKRARSEKPRREKADDKSSSKPVTAEKSQSTRTRSRREGLDGSSEKKKVPVNRSGIQTFIRIALLYLVPALIMTPCTALVLSMTRIILTPLYNSLPLSLHPHIVYFIYLIPPAIIYWRLTSRSSPRELISARVCLGITALAADLVAVGGRRTGSLLARYCGAQWGALLSQGILGVGVVGGGMCFALLCFDHIWPIPPAKQRSSHVVNLFAVGIRSIIYLIHVFYAEKACNWAFSGPMWYLRERPEKQILLLSLIMTVLSFFLRSSTSPITFAQRVQQYYLDRKDLTPATRKKFANLASRLPRDSYPILILIRLPLLVLILRQQLYIHPVTPYVISDGSLRILHSEQSLTGQIVIGENLKDGYRFMRCDHSILGGRWTRDIPDGSGGRIKDMGDSYVLLDNAADFDRIFGCFSLQEIGAMAHRSDASDTIGRTLALTTELDISDTPQPEKGEERALIMYVSFSSAIVKLTESGLGVGIAAAAFARKGYEVDIVEIDPVVYSTAATYFNLSSYPISSVNLLSGSTYIHHLAALSRQKALNKSKELAEEEEGDGFTKWSLVVQDCFSGGSVPGEMFTVEFWRDLSELVERDGIVAMNFVGLRGSRASRAVLVTLLSVFEQCRAFSDGTETEGGEKEIKNMVVFCTMTNSPLLTWRAPTPKDVMRSPMRSHVYSTFHPNEIQLDSIIQKSDWTNPEMMLTKDNFEKLDRWQIDTALATWRAMSNILTPEMWLAW